VRAQLTPGLVRAIAEAVERQGGVYEDVEDLVWTWERVMRRNSERADVIRREAADAQAAVDEQ
jgi:hypothetical protein